MVARCSASPHRATQRRCTSSATFTTTGRARSAHEPPRLHDAARRRRGLPAGGATAGGARRAERAHAPRRCRRRLDPGRRAVRAVPRRVHQGNAGARLGQRAQPSGRVPMDRGERRSDPGHRQGAGRPWPRRHHRALHAGHRRAAARDPHHPDRVRQRVRPRGERLRRHHGDAGRQYDGRDQFRVPRWAGSGSSCCARCGRTFAGP